MLTNSKPRFLKRPPRSNVLGSFMVTDIDYTTNVGTAHFNGGGSTKIDISQFIDKIKSTNNPEIFYIAS